jgi:multiple sugar transport system substrate-binding protein
MKKLSLFLLLVLLAGTLFAVWQQEPTGPVTLTFWTHEDPNRTEIETRYMQEFMAANPDITIERTTNSSAKVPELLLTAFAANQGPDIFNTQIEDEYAYIINARVAPVDAEAVGYKNLKALKSAYVEGVLDPVTLDGDIHGLPLELTNWTVFMNDRVFKSAGLNPDTGYPKTWEDMVRVSEKIAIRDGDILTRRGFDFRYPYYLVSTMPMVEQLGGELISKDGKTAIVGDKAWIAFLTFMQQWGPNGKNLGSPTYTNARRLFNKDNNDVAMCMSGLYQVGRIRNDNQEFYDSGEWRVIPYPQFENAVREVASCYYGHYYMVNVQKSSANQKAAWKFIGYMLSHPEEYLEKVGLIQPTKALMASSTYGEMPYSAVFGADMERGHIVYYAENSAKMQELIREAVESVMLSGVTPDKAVIALKAKAQELLDEL